MSTLPSKTRLWWIYPQVVSRISDPVTNNRIAFDLPTTRMLRARKEVPTAEEIALRQLYN